MRPVIRRPMGNLAPVFTANLPFRLIVRPPAGVLKRLDFYVRGQHTTDITTGATHGEVNYFQAFKLTAKRKNGLPDIVWEALPRDLKKITAMLDGQLMPRANPATAGTSAATAHFGVFSVFFAPPRKKCRFPDDWGLHSDDLIDNDPIVIEGRYGAVTDIGTGATAIAQTTSVTAEVEQTQPGDPKPGLVLGCQATFFPHESDIKSALHTLPLGNVELYCGAMFRSHDNSAAAAQEVDTFPTIIELSHSQRGVVAGDLFIEEKKKTGVWSGLATADVFAGTIMPMASPEFIESQMIRRTEGAFTFFIDSLLTASDETGAVTPTTSDGVHAAVIGAYKTGA